MKSNPGAFVWLLLILMGACSKTPQEEVAASSSATNAAGVVPIEAPVSVADANQAAATLAELTQVVRKYGAEKQRVPADLNELVTAGYLPGIPAAPAGKRFAINKQMEVYLADQ